MNEFYLALGIFGITYASIILDKIPHTLCALLGGMAMIYVGLVTQEMAVQQFIDFNTLGLLAGMMVLISIVRQSGFFEAMALWAVKKSRGKPKKLLVLLALITGIGAALIDSVTAAMLIAPMTISICRMVQINPIPILVTEVLVANIGGTALMIGNPPNVMIGSASGLDFVQFIFHLAPVVVLTLFVTILVMLFLYRNELPAYELSREELNEIHIIDAVQDTQLLKTSLAVLALTICGFMLHAVIGVQSAAIAISGATLSMLVCRMDPEKALQEINMNTLLFFMGLFILVGGLQMAGVIQFIAKTGISFVGKDPQVLTFVILFLSGIASAFVDNIPFTATMIPLIHDIQSILGVQADYMWWALALGACYGGNGTLIGASPNVIIMAEAAQSGFAVTFGKFMKVCFPVMLFTLVIAAFYLYLRYFL